MFTIKAVTFLSLAAMVLADTPTISSPAALIECQPASITIAGGTGPYFVSVIPGSDPSGAALEFLPNQASAGSFTWTVDIASGTDISFKVVGADGVPNYSAHSVIQAGQSSDCVGKNSASSSAAGGAAASGSAAAGTTAATTGKAAATSSRAAAGTTSATSAAGTTAAATTGAATTGASSTPASSSSAAAQTTAPAAGSGAGKIVGTSAAALAFGSFIALFL